LKTFRLLILSTIKNHWPIIVVSVVFAALLFRNPYNTRTLIPNFEPFPDTFHYVTVARCFISQGTWGLCREGIQDALVGAQPSVPQAYSLSLLPVFVFNFDPRSFYFTNVFLSFISLGLIYLILGKVTKSQLIQTFILLLLGTSYHIYWLPTLAMAENLLVPLYVLSMYLLLIKKSRKQLFGLGAVAAAIFFTKYAYMPLSASILLFGVVLILKEHLPSIKKVPAFLKLTAQDVFVLLLPFVASLPFSHNFSQSVSFFVGLLTPVASTATEKSGTTNSYFSLETLQTHLPKYLGVALGKPAQFLWDLRPWYSSSIGIGGLLGLLTGLWNKKYAVLSAFLVVSSLAQITFMSTFYAFDTRYIYSAFFAILIGVALILEFFNTNHVIQNGIKKIRLPKQVAVLGVLGILSVFLLVPRLGIVKAQLGLNLKYAETPWWYLSVLEYNSFFSNKRQEEPQLISLTSPFMIDYYSNNTYVVLPFDEQQDFANQRETVWGIPADQTLVETYTQKLEAGENLYLATYGKEANDHLRSTFLMYQDTFELTLEQEGCYNLCNIYSVALKNTSIKSH